MGGLRLRCTSAVLALATLAHAQEPAGDVQKVTDPTGREVGYPTRLTEVITGATSARAVQPQVAIANGEAVLTKMANTHVRMRPDDPDAVLFANTFVRFDLANRWLLRRGAVFVVNRRGKLALVAEGLETLFVGSQVYVEVTEAGLLAYVLEGNVILGATSTGIPLGSSQAGRVARGGRPERTVLSRGEQARVDQQIRLARNVMGESALTRPRGGGGGKAVGVLLGLGAVGAGVYVFTHQKQPDLVAVPGQGGTFCSFDARENLVVTVGNRGEKEAPATTTRVDFTGLRGAAPQFFATAALAAGQSVTLGPVQRPNCSTCTIEITVDSDGEVKESNEDNNLAVGDCLSIVGEGPRPPSAGHRPEVNVTAVTPPRNGAWVQPSAH